eukprot:604489-Rhodomonas_salina.2
MLASSVASSRAADGGREENQEIVPETALRFADAERSTPPQHQTTASPFQSNLPVPLAPSHRALNPAGSEAIVRHRCEGRVGYAEPGFHIVHRVPGGAPPSSSSGTLRASSFTSYDR